MVKTKQIVNPSVLNPDINQADITSVQFIDDVVGLGNKQILVNAEHFDVIDFEGDTAMFVLNWGRFSQAVDAHVQPFLDSKDYESYDHMKMMQGMLEHDFVSFDTMKLLYIDGEGITGTYMIDISDESSVDMTHEFINQTLIIKLKRIK